MAASNRNLQVSTWNIAAINNNPFEYWITYDENPEYEKIMTAIEEFLENPDDKDVAVSEVFTEEMFSELEKKMDGVGWDNVRSYWDSDFKNRKIVSGFMKVSWKLHDRGRVQFVCYSLAALMDKHNIQIAFRTHFWGASD